MKHLLSAIALLVVLSACGGDVNVESPTDGPSDAPISTDPETGVDTDNDGIIDNDDECPTKKGPKPTGCPESTITDTDGDGIADNDDQCPTKKGSLPTGCPDDTINDRDGDGIEDSEDKCPDEKGIAAKDGCPAVDDIDTDKDGVNDSEDNCPEVVGPAVNNGCPVQDKDTDEDGVMDSIDQCDEVAGPVDNNGCPWLDTDNDSILDKDDKCPLMQGWQSNAGCPWQDEDNDGVGDQVDKCVGVTGSKDYEGCPVPDTDNDGINDLEDKCPEESANTEDGCPIDRGIVLPGKLQAEEYINYSDTTEANQGGAYREDGVDLDTTTDTDGGFVVGWTTAGEWLEYEISISQAGSYEVSARVASLPGGGEFTLILDGTPIGSSFKVGKTEGWDTWVSQTQTIDALSAGKHVLRVNIVTGDFNLNWLEFKVASDPVSDRDGDGIPDASDNCPDEKGLPEDMGCPVNPPIEYDLANGLKQYEEHCARCHDDANVDIKGTKVLFANAEIVGSDGSFSCTSTNCSEVLALSEYIDKNMPYGGEVHLCVGECAQDTAYYISQTMGKGIPPKLIDTDKDGVPDSEDDCDNEKGPVSNKGCPVIAQPDTDGDGVIDSEDKCINEKGPASNEGCPIVVDQDTDGDGVIDSEDKCINEKGPASNEGCPIVVDQDTDGDGVIDSEDKCINEKGPASNEGCPVPLDGKALYSEKNCHLCHGVDGAGIEQADGSFSSKIVLENWDEAALTKVITETMPKGSPTSCDAACSAAISKYLMSLVTEVSCDAEPELLPQRLRLLTPFEFENSLNDLLNLNRTDIAGSLPVTATVRGFDNNAAQTSVSSSHMDQYWNAAVDVSNAFNAESLLNCGGKNKGICAQDFVAEFGLKAFRRPLSMVERDSFVDLFDLSDDVAKGARYAVRAMLVSPSFLYRSEIGTTVGNSTTLGAYETAALLSYTFWGSIPDTTLIEAAASNSLSTVAQLRAQVDRMLKDDRAKAQFSHFAKQWLHIEDLENVDKSNTEYPNYNAELAQAMEKEIDLFITDLFLNGASSFSDLFLNDFIYVNNTLANFYGINGVTSSAFTTVPSGEQRGGILNMAGFLTSLGKRDQSSPILRGVYVREHLLCQEFSTPPANVGEVEPLDPTKTTRERFKAHTDNEGCSSCHSKIDPIGFSFERYDGIGQFRLTEGNNIDVDDSGRMDGLVNMNDPDSQPYNGTKGLSGILANADNVSNCFVEHFHTYMEGIAKPDSCKVNNVAERWKGESYNLYDLWLESVSSANFLQRK